MVVKWVKQVWFLSVLAMVSLWLGFGNPHIKIWFNVLAVLAALMALGVYYTKEPEDEMKDVLEDFK